MFLKFEICKTKSKIYRKKRTGEKERTSNWSNNVYEVDKTTHGHPYFELIGLDRQYLRNELLKV